MYIALRDTYRPAACRGGVGYFTILLSQALNKKVRKMDIYTAEPAAFEGCTAIMDKTFELSRFHRKIRTIQKILKPDTLASGYSTVIFMHPYEPLVSAPGAKRVLIMYDLIPLLVRSKNLKGTLHFFYYHFILRRILRKYDKIVVISENTKKDLLKEYHLPTSQVYVIPCGYNSKLRTISSSYVNPYRKDGSYIICIGGLSPHKNINRLIQAMALIDKRLDLRLVVVGIAETNESLEYTRKHGVQDRVLFLGRISDDKLAVILRDASALVFPSLYEGFGMPPLEAMSLGVPTAVSNCSSMPDVCGDASVYFNPLDVNDIAASIETITTVQDVRKSCIHKGYAQVQKYRWDVIADKYIELITGLELEATIL